MVVLITVAAIMLFKIVFTSTAFKITESGSFSFLHSQARLVATMLAATLNLIAIGNVQFFNSKFLINFTTVFTTKKTVFTSVKNVFTSVKTVFTKVKTVFNKVKLFLIQ